LVTGNDAEERDESGMPRFAPVESEHEFIEIDLKMFTTQAVIDTEAPGFQVREHPVDGRHDDMRGHRADDMRFMADVRWAQIGGQAVRLGRRTGAMLAFMGSDA
jgi:hypothetical protein